MNNRIYPLNWVCFMDIKEMELPGVFSIESFARVDNRGQFVKTYREKDFQNAGLNFNFVEKYYSHSFKNVLRGMHFQIPPYQHDKLVYCVLGEIFDVVLDLRIGSPKFGKSQSIILSAVTPHMLYIPAGIAHGFYTLSNTATVMYEVTSYHSIDHDQGVHWNSFEMSWPSNNSILSKRDNEFPSLSQFTSPFRFNE